MIDPNKRAAEIGQELAVREIDEGLERARRVGIQSGALEAFNRDLITAGLCPDAIADAYPITMQLGVWIGKQLRDGLPLELAIAQIDEVVGTPIETLLRECATREDKVLTIMLKAALDALAVCCLPGMAVEAATFIIKTTSAAAMQTLEDHLPTA